MSLSYIIQIEKLFIYTQVQFIFFSYDYQQISSDWYLLHSLQYSLPSKLDQLHFRIDLVQFDSLCNIQFSYGSNFYGFPHQRLHIVSCFLVRIFWGFLLQKTFSQNVNLCRIWYYSLIVIFLLSLRNHSIYHKFQLIWN